MFIVAANKFVVKFVFYVNKICGHAQNIQDKFEPFILYADIMLVHCTLYILQILSPVFLSTVVVHIPF